MSKNPTYKLLDKIHYPEDLRWLDPSQLPEVCRELRQDIIDEAAIPDISPPAWVLWN